VVVQVQSGEAEAEIGLAGGASVLAGSIEGDDGMRPKAFKIHGSAEEKLLDSF
jgi:hypothetical protein